MLYKVKLIIILIVFFKLLYMLLVLFQQEHYKNSHICYFLKRYYLKTPLMYAIYLSLLFILKYYYLDIFICSIILSLSFIKCKFIKPLKFTRRVRRLIYTTLLITLFIVISLRSVHAIPYTLLAIITFLPIIIVLANIINKPFELLVKNHFIRQAKKKLDEFKNITICITGSFGKTSVKNILYNVLKDKYYTLATPSSYNTTEGICKCINESLNPLHEVFITEAGANKIGDIEEITKLVNPTCGAITSIGDMHLDSFKTLDNVLKCKLELPMNMHDNCVCIIDKQIDISNYSFNTLVIRTNDLIGVHATNIKESLDGIIFDIYNNNEFVMEINSKLIGLHNVSNIVMVYSIVKALSGYGLNINDEEFASSIKRMPSVSNRLEKKELHFGKCTFTIIDDSYNSNIVGFKNALRILSNTIYSKVLITPGIVDNKYIDYKDLIEYLLDDIDIYLIYNTYIDNLIDYLNLYGIKYSICHSFKEAYHQALEKYKDNDYCTLLIENDLPDNYLMR